MFAFRFVEFVSLWLGLTSVVFRKLPFPKNLQRRRDTRDLNSTVDKMIAERRAALEKVRPAPFYVAVCLE